MAELQADGVFEEAEGNMRQALMGAAQLARTATRARRDAAQRATRRELEEARQQQAQLDAQRVAARAELAPVDESSWWDQAQMRDVARAYETAVTFRGEDQAARDAESCIRQELRERADRDERQAQARGDQDLAAGLVVGAEVFEVSTDLAEAEEAQDLRDLAADVEHDAGLSWDSAERRELHAQGITAGPDQAAAATAWKQADVDQARHPRRALQGGRKGKSFSARVSAATFDRQIGLRVR